jgi:hypothetical protein
LSRVTFVAFVGDLDFGLGIQEMAEQLAEVGEFISGEPTAQHPIQSAGHFGHVTSKDSRQSTGALDTNAGWRGGCVPVGNRFFNRM